MERRDLTRLLISALIITVADAVFSYVMGRERMDGEHIVILAALIATLAAIRD
jgi:hypothetical protein